MVDREYLRIPNLREGYVTLCNHVLTHGDKATVRGLPMREIRSATVVCEDSTDTLPTGVNRKLNTSIAAAEAAQLVGGVSWPQVMINVQSRFASFMRDGTFHGAYGVRMRFAWPKIVSTLTKDRSSRQAVAAIWRNELDLDIRDPDVPCTALFQFQLRNDVLDMDVYMRSQDIWWGTVHDFFQFTQVQQTIANVLNVKPGRYTLHAGNLHLYERDIPGIEALTPADDTYRFRPSGFMGVTMEDAMDQAARIFTGPTDLDMRSETVRWYIERLGKHLGG